MGIQEPANKARDYTPLFDRLDMSRPELSGARAALAGGDQPAAEHAVAEHYRHVLPGRFPVRGRVAGSHYYWERPGRDVAARALRHQLEFQGRWWGVGEKIDWRFNPTRGESFTVEFTSSLNRHGWFLAVSQAYVETADERYAREFVRQLKGFWGSLAGGAAHG